VFEPAIAPHIAAREAGREIPLSGMVDWYRRVTADAELAVVEGAGGWRVPLHPAGFLSDLPEALQMDVILVVGLTLGCLNHARLTAEAIARSGRCRLVGWVANAIDPGFERVAENLQTLADLLGAAPLAQVGRLGEATQSSQDCVQVAFDWTASLQAALAVRADG
jgi:dethiobiotin synthetase